MSKKTKRVQPTKQQIIATANIGIADAVESLTPEDGRRDYNPHVVKVREQLMELECKIATMIGDPRRAVEAKQS